MFLVKAHRQREAWYAWSGRLTGGKREITV